MISFRRIVIWNKLLFNIYNSTKRSKNIELKFDASFCTARFVGSKAEWVNSVFNIFQLFNTCSISFGLSNVFVLTTLFSSTNEKVEQKKIRKEQKNRCKKKWRNFFGSYFLKVSLAYSLKWNGPLCWNTTD